MEEYVTKEKTLAQLERCARDPYHETHYKRDAAINTIKRMESADVVKVVRCKDCSFWHGNTQYCGKFSIPNWAQRTPPDGFCAFGERKDDEDR